jgi:DNA-directed RNA polymerase subunit RPC12/RpoP
MTTVEFRCACGQRILARADQGGKSYRCPKCSSAVRIPKVAAVKEGEVLAGSRSISDRNPDLLVPAPSRQFFRIPATVGEMFIYMLACWLVLAATAAILWFFSISLIGAILFSLCTLAASEQIWRLLRSRQTVLEKKEVSLLWGFVKLIAWDPVEGVLILKNKNIAFSDDNLLDARGGIRFIYPVLGEEVAVRVPLEIQTLDFRDENVLTREYLQLTVIGTMKWHIVNINQFYLLGSV